jgi:ABC-2 type transport system permease protein
VEVIVSSVKPFQLMMGKVLGIAAVGLTQIIIWIALSGILISVISMSFAQDQLPDMKQLEQMGQAAQQMPVSDMQQLFAGFKSLNLPLIALTFIFYFAGGYLLYSALFAAVGAAVDNETETQQFMLPITLPLVLAFVLSTSVVMRDPNGPMAFWLSIIPFTSPVVMMVRIPFMSFPTQAWELGLSMLLLIAFFIGTIWVAGRIYRTGILMYGKKATYGELLKWLFYKS